MPAATAAPKNRKTMNLLFAQKSMTLLIMRNPLALRPFEKREAALC
jgi:hypothetical protein